MVVVSGVPFHYYYLHNEQICFDFATLVPWVLINKTFLILYDWYVLYFNVLVYIPLKFCIFTLFFVILESNYCFILEVFSGVHMIVQIIADIFMKLIHLLIG